MIDGTEKPKIPSKFAIRAARYDEFRCNINSSKAGGPQIDFRELKNHDEVHDDDVC